MNNEINIPELIFYSTATMQTFLWSSSKCNSNIILILMKQSKHSKAWSICSSVKWININNNEHYTCYRWYDSLRPAGIKPRFLKLLHLLCICCWNVLKFLEVKYNFGTTRYCMIRWRHVGKGIIGKKIINYSWRLSVSNKKQEKANK